MVQYPDSVANALAAQYILIFDLLEGSMFIMLAVMLATALFSKNVRRGRTWYSFIASTMLGSLSYILLVGRQGSPNPPFSMCLMQAAAIYASNPFITLAAFALILELFLNLSAAVHFKPKVNRMWGISLVVIPLFVYCAMIAYVVFIGLRHPNLVNINAPGMFCHMDSLNAPGFVNPFVVSAALTALAQGLVIIFCCITTRILFLHKKRTGILVDDPSFSIAIFIRRTVLLAFECIIGITLAATSFDSASNSALWCIALPLMPLAVVVIFGTQPDMLGVVFPCCICKFAIRRRRRRVVTETGLSSMAPSFHTDQNGE